jgi:hypothetical protein
LVHVLESLAPERDKEEAWLGAVFARMRHCRREGMPLFEMPPLLRVRT